MPVIRVKGLPLPASDPGLRRVSVHAGSADVDLALPAGVPVAILIPSIVDVLDGRGVTGAGGLEAVRYQLSAPGRSALDPSMTLAQNGVRDGDVLVLTESRTPPPPPRHHDVARAVSAALGGASAPGSDRQAARRAGATAAGCLTATGALVLIRNTYEASAFGVRGATAGVAAAGGFIALLGAALAQRAYRDRMAALALSVLGTAFAALAGFLAVPGAAGLPNTLLATSAAAATSVLASRLTGCCSVTLTAISCAATLIAIAALAGVLTAAPLPAISSVTALISLGLLGMAARLSIILAGLSPGLPPPDVEAADGLADKAIRAGDWLAALQAAFSSSTAVGAVVTVLAGATRPPCLAFGAVTGALLLSRARSDDRRRTKVSAIGGTAVISTTFGVMAFGMPGRGPWIAAATAMLAAAAIYLGFVLPALRLSPIVRRGAEVLECVALVAMVPLTCWVCGVYSAVRGWHLT